MPATTPNPAKNAERDTAKANGNGPSFVRCDLNKAQKEQLTMWHQETDREDVVSWLFTMVERGHTVSMRTNEVGYQCSVTGMTEMSGHKDLCLVARASTAEKALYGVMFRDMVLLEQNWPRAGRLDELDF